MKCELINQNKGKPEKVRLEFDGSVITESVFTKMDGNPRTKQIPRALFGDDPKRYIGRRMFELMGTGYSVNSEDTELAKDRMCTTAMMSDARLVVFMKLVVTRNQWDVLNAGRSLLAHDMLVSHAVSPMSQSVCLSFLHSCLNAHQATLLALAHRCSNSTSTTANFLGDLVDLPTLVKPLRNFESLSDEVLDQFEDMGIALRTVDYRKIKPDIAGFVGV